MIRHICVSCAIIIEYGDTTHIPQCETRAGELKYLDMMEINSFGKTFIPTDEVAHESCDVCEEERPEGHVFVATEVQRY